MARFFCCGDGALGTVYIYIYVARMCADIINSLVVQLDNFSIIPYRQKYPKINFCILYMVCSGANCISHPFQGGSEMLFCEFNRGVVLRNICVLFILSALLFLMPLSAGAQDTMKFGVPPWPGVTVKTAVATQILDAMGYDTKQFEVGPTIVYKGLTTGDVDAYLAAWMPAQKNMFDPLVEKDKIDVVAVNLDQAQIGLSVPDYVWEAGVKSVADLDRYADKFDHTIYGIEPGSAMNTSTEEIIENDVAGLGDWNVQGSTTPTMLSAVQDRVRQGQWVVFHGWKPHWMNVAIDMDYLEPVPGTEKLINKSTIYTVVSNDFLKRFPQAHAFLKKFYVTSDMQSSWIHSFGYKKVAAEEVAHDWIAANMDEVAKWLEGVKSADGSKPAIDAVKAAFK